MSVHCCNVCGERLTPFFRKVLDPLTKETFRIERCFRCGLGHTIPQPADQTPYYAVGYYGNRHGLTASHCSRRRLKFVNTAMGSGRRGRLLDIGCGDGSFLLTAQRAGWEVVGTELNPSTARGLGLDVKENLDRLGDGEIFDCITMWHTLEHMRDIPSVLRSVSMHLGAEGRLVVAVPDWGGIQAKMFGERWLHLDVPRHLYHFNRGSLEYCLGSAGFIIELCRHMEFEYDLLGWSQSALNYIMPDPNIFFDTLTGKRSGIGPGMRGAAVALGVLLSVAALPAVAAESMAGRGGTLICSARKRG